MKTINYSPHAFSLFALFVCGNAIITLPFYNTHRPFACLLISAVISFLFVFVSTLIINLSQKNAFAFITVAAIVGGLSLYSGAMAFYDYLRFVSQVQLPQTNILFLAVVMVVMIVIFATSPVSAIYKYCLLVGTISAVMIILMLLGGIKHFDFLQPAANDNTVYLSDWSKIFFRYFASLPVPLLFVLLTNNTTGIRVPLGGVVMVFLIIAIVCMQSIFTLGSKGNYAYPYISAVGVISSGSLFTRYDGLVYFVFFATAITKLGVCAKTITLIIKRINSLTK